ncbi:MAG: EAL domain-containing protein [Gammaproteobacteria bacterium]|jgi:diguanylate cyclase (GGDEF)-like protein/PAS domain S-box-containing protein|nr:EAL domain-containing protein [Gammaproteobacteria bacterium]
MAENTINLIIVDDSFDTEEKVISTLRTLGYATRSSRAEDDEDLIDAIKARHPDLVLYSQGMELISLAQTCKIVQNKTGNILIPVIAVDKSKATDSITDVINAGAMDLSSYQNMKHLAQVIHREVRAYRNWKKNLELQKILDESELRCNSLLDSSRDAIAYIHEGMHVYSNASYLELFNISQSDELEGIPILDMVAHSSRDDFKAFLREYMKTDSGLKKLVTRLHKPDGKEFDGEMEFSAARIDGEPCIQIVIRKEDVNTEELERQLKLLSQKDQLTGLYNRQHCLEELETIISECEGNDNTAAIMEIRLDNFDNIKNEVGVVGADHYIVAIAKALAECTHENDILSRYTHASFTILSRGSDKGFIEKYAKEIQEKISEYEVQIKDETVNTTCSTGIVLINKNSPDCNEVLARVEKASNEAAANGTNQISLYVPKEGELTRHEADSKFKGQLTDAIMHNRFVLYYQPIVSLHGDTDERYEVFVRLKGEDGNLIMPQDFFPAAERIGMAIAIDRWVLTHTIQVLSERWKKGNRTRFFIKLSAPSLKDDTLIAWLDYQIKEKKLPADCLIFEVKETAAVTNLKYTKVICESLKKINCGFVLDDFGTGANPFQLLDHIDVDYIRLDRSFMENLTESEKDQEAVQSITAQAAERGKLTITQFVPDAGSLSILWGMNVNFIQGYFLQEPSPVLNYDFTNMGG